MTNDGLDLLEMVRRELAPTEGANRFVQLVSEGRLPSERLAAVAGEEYWIGESDRPASFTSPRDSRNLPPWTSSSVSRRSNPARSQLLRYAAALGR